MLLQPGSVLIRPCGQAHSNEFEMAVARVLLIEFEPDRYTRLQLDRHFRRPACFCPWTLGISAVELESELHLLDETSAVALEGMSLVLVSRALRRAAERFPQREPCWLNEAIRIVRTSYRENLTLGRIARLVKVHPVTLASRFKSHTGASVGAALMNLRVEEARRMLLQTELPVAEIAAGLGFYDQSHLGRVFKRRVGCSPGRFRRTAVREQK